MTQKTIAPDEIPFPNPISGWNSNVEVTVVATFKNAHVAEYRTIAMDLSFLCAALEGQIEKGLLRHYSVVRAGVQRTKEYFGFTEEYPGWKVEDSVDEFFDSAYELPETKLNLRMLEIRSYRVPQGPWFYHGPKFGDGGGKYNAVETIKFEEIVGECGLSDDEATYFASVYPEVLRELIALARVGLRYQRGANPSGEWVFVPKQATEAMMHAAEDIEPPRPYGAVYRAMIAAAPVARPVPTSVLENIVDTLLADRKVIESPDLRAKMILMCAKIVSVARA